jgi:hypothetical protein
MSTSSPEVSISNLNLIVYNAYRSECQCMLNTTINLSRVIKSNMNLSGFVTFKHQQSEVLNINLNLSGGVKNRHQPVSEFFVNRQVISSSQPPGSPLRCILSSHPHDKARSHEFLLSWTSEVSRVPILLNCLCFMSSHHTEQARFHEFPSYWTG